MSDIYFIAEIGINHNGSLDTAFELIDAAVESGADCVKFQKRTPEICVPKSKWHDKRKTPDGIVDYIDYKKRMEFDAKQYRQIASYCSHKGIHWTASVWDIPSVEFISKFDIPFIKVPSALITDIGLLDAIATVCNEKEISVVMSIGMSTEKQALDAINYFMSRGINPVILHCNSSYPANENELDLSYIKVLKKKFPQSLIGYSGHEIGTLPTLVATAIGSEVIERHITLDRDMWGTDHKASLEPDELKKLIHDIERVGITLGESQLTVYQSEAEVAKKLRP